MSYLLPKMLYYFQSKQLFDAYFFNPLCIRHLSPTLTQKYHSFYCWTEKKQQQQVTLESIL